MMHFIKKSHQLIICNGYEIILYKVPKNREFFCEAEMTNLPNQIKNYLKKMMKKRKE